MLLSEADREAVIEILKRHAAAGRLDVGELERRVEAVVEAGTREEATAVLADLPALPATSTEGGSGGRPWLRRGRGHGDADKPAADWQPTSERFRDPRSGRVMRVWVDAGGGRHYVPDASV
jgi:hypothetical protein